MLTILWWVIVGLIAGWITGKIMKGKGYGVGMDIVLGIAFAQKRFGDLRQLGAILKPIRHIGAIEIGT